MTVSAQAATAIMVGFIVFLGVIVPMIEGSKRFRKFISLRWIIVVFALTLCLGVIINFKGLSDDLRRIVIVGALVISGVFLIIRSIEKALANGWRLRSDVEVQHGNTKIIIDSQKDDKSA